MLLNEFLLRRDGYLVDVSGISVAASSPESTQKAVHDMKMNSQTIRDVLSKRFSPYFIEVLDESGQHQGHPGSRKSGGGHYRLILVSDDFEGKKPLERHQAVYKALGAGRNNSIHVLAIQAYTVREWEEKNVGKDR